MFTKEITDLTIISETANALFPNISFYNTIFRNDKSLMATIRVLLYGRIKKEDELRVFLNVRNAKFDTVRGANDDDVNKWLASSIYDYGMPNNTLQIVGINTDVDYHITGEGKKYFELIDRSFLKTFSEYGLTLSEDIVRYFAQSKVNARLFVSTERHISILFVENIDMKKWHYIQHIMPRYLPWFFNNKPVTAEEKEFLCSLANRYSPKYEEYVEAFASKLDFRSIIIRSKLGGFENTFIKSQLDEIRNGIRSCNDRIRTLESELASWAKQLSEDRIRESGILAKLAGLDGEAKDELLEYFLANKTLELKNANNGRIDFMVNTVFANWNPDLAEKYIKNNNSCFYKPYYSHMKYELADTLTYDRMQKLLTEIFLTERFRLRTVATYYLDFRTFNYHGRGKDSISYSEAELATHIKNPHIWQYECLGDNSQRIREAVRNRDYISAIENCSASARSLNLTEANTASYLMYDLYSSSCGKVIEMPDGTLKTPLEAVEWLEAEDAAKRDNTESERVQATDEIREEKGTEDE